MQKSITYLSDPKSVSMEDKWYEIANLNHFWIRRRFDVFRKLVEHLDDFGSLIAEVGCGHGLVQKQFEDYFGLFVDGFDLNELALKNSVAHGHLLYYYDINERQDTFQNRYDQIILFDTIEHLADPEVFLESAVYMVKSGGLIVINVPALQSMYSGYDLVAGHYCRYDIKALSSLINTQQVSLERISYWGATLVPILVARKLLFILQQSSETTFEKGFSPANDLINKMLYKWSRLEKIPQRLTGSSLMAIVRKK